MWWLLWLFRTRPWRNDVHANKVLANCATEHAGTQRPNGRPKNGTKCAEKNHHHRHTKSTLKLSRFPVRTAQSKPSRRNGEILPKSNRKLTHACIHCRMCTGASDCQIQRTRRKMSRNPASRRNMWNSSTASVSNINNLVNVLQPPPEASTPVVAQNRGPTTLSKNWKNLGHLSLFATDDELNLRHNSTVNPAQDCKNFLLHDHRKVDVHLQEGRGTRSTPSHRTTQSATKTPSTREKQGPAEETPSTELRGPATKTNARMYDPAS